VEHLELSGAMWNILKDASEYGRARLVEVELSTVFSIFFIS